MLGSIVLERQVEHRPSTVARLRAVLMEGRRVSVWLEVDRATGQIVLVEEQYRP